MNNLSDRDGIFYVNHVGKGSPVNVQRASPGSRWVDLTTGKIYTYRGGYGTGSGNAAGWF